ncbi:hypothetical protein A9975_28550 [Cupriavidus sp. UME77]|nr:hypothetical protein [Cupriavidus sp. UME77]
MLIAPSESALIFRAKIYIVPNDNQIANLWKQEIIRLINNTKGLPDQLVFNALIGCLPHILTRRIIF